MHLVQVDRFHGIIVEMPPPQTATEAYFVALLPTADAHDPQRTVATALRYLVLEKGIGDAVGEATVLCEWTQPHAWRRLGEGPPPQLESFVDALRRLMQ